MYKAVQLSFPSHGGRRAGAGRPRRPGARIRHRSRGEASRRHPTLVTVKVRRGLPSLRSRRLLRDLTRGLRALRARESFRVVHFSLQGNHLHALVEAEDARALARGMMALCSRLARTVQRTFGVVGSVLADRYHSKPLRTPREVRAALAYVLLNARRHAAQRGQTSRWALDPASSGAWFDGWRTLPRARAPDPPVLEPRTWLLRIGWKRWGLIDPTEVPGDRRPARGV